MSNHGIIWISKGRAGCKGNTYTERKDGLLIHRCQSCSLHWTQPEPKP